jgi:hypothetical protein
VTFGTGVVPRRHDKLGELRKLSVDEEARAKAAPGTPPLVLPVIPESRFFLVLPWFVLVRPLLLVLPVPSSCRPSPSSS